jgi:hypothetical protein
MNLFAFELVAVSGTFPFSGFLFPELWQKVRKAAKKRQQIFNTTG